MTSKATTAVKFIVIIGTDVDSIRTPALEVGPFRTLTDARRYCVEARDVSLADLHGDAEFAQIYDGYELDPADYPQYVATGATINYYSDALGTYDSIDVY